MALLIVMKAAMSLCLLHAARSLECHVTHVDRTEFHEFPQGTIVCETKADGLCFEARRKKTGSEPVLFVELGCGECKPVDGVECKSCSNKSFCNDAFGKELKNEIQMNRLNKILLCIDSSQGKKRTYCKASDECATGKTKEGQAWYGCYADCQTQATDCQKCGTPECNRPYITTKAPTAKLGSKLRGQTGALTLSAAVSATALWALQFM